MPQPDEPLYCSEQINIPPELPDILKQFTKAAIRTAPKDVLAWSAAYVSHKYTPSSHCYLFLLWIWQTCTFLHLHGLCSSFVMFVNITISTQLFIAIEQPNCIHYPALKAFLSLESLCVPFMVYTIMLCMALFQVLPCHGQWWNPTCEGASRDAICHTENRHRSYSRSPQGAQQTGGATSMYLLIFADMYTLATLNKGKSAVQQRIWKIETEIT